MKIARAVSPFLLGATLALPVFHANAQTPSNATNDPPRRSASQAVDDTTITAKVKSELIQDDLVKARNINVDTNRGVVSLSGQVQSAAERDKAVTLAKQVAGVLDVKDNLSISSSSVGASAPPSTGKSEPQR
jgi:hyperosmotically inducible periplasmic protein